MIIKLGIVLFPVFNTFLYILFSVSFLFWESRDRSITLIENLQGKQIHGIADPAIYEKSTGTWFTVMIIKKKGMDMNNKLFINGIIYTMNKNQPYVTAVAVEDGKIKVTGTDDEVLKFKKADSEIIDLQGKTMLPGFIDAHCHPALSAFWLSGMIIDIMYDREQVLEYIKKYVEEHPDNDSYFGLGYAEWIYDEKGPHKKYLDEICSDKPIFILGSGGHEGWCNSKAFEVTGIKKDTPDPLPGFQYFEKDDNGELTGHIVETATTKMLFTNYEWFDQNGIEENLSVVFKEYAKMGVTSLIDCGTFDYMEEMAIEKYSNYEKRGELKQRINSCVMVESPARWDEALPILCKRHKEHHSDNYNINTFKIVNDGTMEDRSASLFEPYEEDGSMVEPMISGKKLRNKCLEVAEEGLDMHIHAIGDKAVYETLMAAKTVRDAGYDDMRITNAHTDLVRDKDNKLFAKYNVTANTSGVWHYGNPAMEKVLGKRNDNTFKMMSLIKEGARVSMGSDKPVDEFGPEPLKGIQTAVTRQLLVGKDAPVLKPFDEKMSVYLCLEAYTKNAAYQMRMEDKTGSIEPGKYADFVVLEKDVFNVDKYEIKDIKIEMTFKDGKRTW